jgi:hypothetical protein
MQMSTAASAKEIRDIEQEIRENQLASMEDHWSKKWTVKKSTRDRQSKESTVKKPNNKKVAAKKAVAKTQSKKAV